MTDKKVSDSGETRVLPSVAAKMLHVDPRTLQRMAERGEVDAIRLPSGHRRYSVKSIEAIISKGAEDALKGARRRGSAA